MKFAIFILSFIMLANTGGPAVATESVTGSGRTVTASAGMPSAVDVKTIRCNSDSGQRKYCPVDTKGGVRLTYQYSHAGCWEGDTWGYDGRGIWVSNGCRAEFEVGEKGLSTGQKTAIGVGLGALAAGIVGAIVANKDKDDEGNYNPYYNDRVKCSSDDMRYHACQTGRNRYVELARQISGSPCRFNETWGYNRTGIWVDRGCRAEFYVYR